MTIEERQIEVTEEFELFDDWMDKYEYIIELGKKLPLIDEKYKDEPHLVKGCQSEVWLRVEEKNGILHFTADSDAVITKGIIALLIRILNEQPASEVANANLHFIGDIGLQQHLSPNRSNGLASMVQRMKQFAMAYAG